MRDINKQFKTGQAVDRSLECGPSQQEQMLDVINQMEQGILVWSPDAVCLLHNERIFQVLELGPHDLQVGMTRETFLGITVAQGVITAERKAEVLELFETGQPFHFDRDMPSGKVISHATSMLSGP